MNDAGNDAMNPGWYLYRLRKMSPSEVVKRVIEHAHIYGSRLKYRHAIKWPYERFAQNDSTLALSATTDNSI